MDLICHETTLSCDGVSTLLWDGDELVDVTNGVRFRLDGSSSPRTWVVGYPFDRAVGLSHDNAFWSVAYQNRGTKGILIKDGKILREINRSYYFAATYDYPVALALAPNGKLILIHCPTSFDTLEFEDAETGVTLATKKTAEMEFHSRLLLSPTCKYMLDAGWFWHPLGGAWVCDLNGLLGGSGEALTDVSFTFGAEIDSAAFLDDDAVVVTSTHQLCNEEIPTTGIGPMRVGLYSLSSGRWRSVAELGETTGTIMAWRDWAISFYDFPKAIEIATGRVVHCWRHIQTGRQVGCIELGDPPPPPIACDPQNGRFAVASANEITVVDLAVL